MNRTRRINDIGLGLAGADNEKLKDLRVYVENGGVQVWSEHKDGSEALQYLSPVEAMAFAKAFERCAIQALKETAA